jgi:Ca-activated chloride channel family protein
MRLATLLPFLFLATACGSRQHPAANTSDPLAAVTDPKLITMTAENTAELVLADTPSKLAVRIRVSAGDLPAGGRPPLNLTLLLDTSGSMEGEAIDDLRAAARALVAEMGPHDKISVVAFHSVGEVLVPTTVLDDKARRDVDRRLEEITARGTTAMAEGLAYALQQNAAGHAADTIDRIVLLGDGVPNDPASIPGYVQAALQQRVSITTLGLGIEFDPVLLAQIANDTGGVYRYIDEDEEVAAIFDRSSCACSR